MPSPRSYATQYSSPGQRLAAVRARDTAADGRFVYAVTTTGVYCKPSCRSRPARSENISFYATSSDAERAGFRACKRCRPDQTAPIPDAITTLVTDTCRFITETSTVPSLTQLAARSGVSASHLHRVFKKSTGVTPKQYIDTERKKRLQAELQAQSSVTRAVYGSGFNSAGRFYEQAHELLGMTPTTFKRGGHGMSIRFATAKCSLGALLVACSPRGICAISLGDEPDVLVSELKRQFPNAELQGGDSEFDILVAKVVAVVEQPQMSVELPLDIRGTAFQCRVWEVLCRIPPGETVSYTELAQLVGKPSAVRAVASACATNNLAVVIPCHRVVRSNGELSGYRWGMERKRQLLDKEALLSADRSEHDSS